MPRAHRNKSKNPPAPAASPMRVLAYNPAPYPIHFYPPRPNPIGTVTLVVLALLAVGAVGGTVYYVKQRKAKGASSVLPLPPGPGPAPPSPTPPASARDLGTFAGSELVTLPDPVIFVLGAGDHFEIDLTGNYDLFWVRYENESPVEVADLGIDRQRIAAPAAWTPQSFARVTLLGPSIDVFKTLWIMGTGAAAPTA